jgi:hypothetical protein
MKKFTLFSSPKYRFYARIISIAFANKSTVRHSLQNHATDDVEDGLEYYSAVESKCDCIITGNDFYFSKIEVPSSEDFFQKYLFSN